MEETIKKNLFVMTRSLVKDYHWICKPTDFDENMLLEKFEEIFSSLKSSQKGIFTSKWYKLQVKGNNNQIVFRIVVDGRKDVDGRLIRRYEGSAFSNITLQDIPILENCLQEKQEETNNYEYGNFSPTEKNIAHKRKKVENCTIEMEDGKIVIKSDLLASFLQEHTYEELMSLLQIDSNNIDKEH